MENIRSLQGAPGVQMTEIPPSISLQPEEEEDPDVRDSQRDQLVVDTNEFYDNDQDQDQDDQEDMGQINLEEV